MSRVPRERYVSRRDRNRDQRDQRDQRELRDERPSYRRNSEKVYSLGYLVIKGHFDGCSTCFGNRKYVALSV